jgi:hypothetical protein
VDTPSARRDKSPTLEEDEDRHPLSIKSYLFLLCQVELLVGEIVGPPGNRTRTLSMQMTRRRDRSRARPFTGPFYRHLLRTTLTPSPQVEMRFGEIVDDLVIHGDQVTGALVRNLSTGAVETMSADRVVLGVGHSARDVYQMLHGHGVQMTQKDFAVRSGSWMHGGPHEVEIVMARMI